ncbi:MAG: acyl-CoA reductase [Flavobacteriales bacterium]|nr:acyl-CoA reductase [Flavobacteriales bacterium]|tara:strand:+ start:11826 stop:12872 length:1047 start_codon:yes stop_codon:yes gene_type:complete
MNDEKLINTLSKLSYLLTNIFSTYSNKRYYNTFLKDEIIKNIDIISELNPWFEKRYIEKSLTSILNYLNIENLNNFLSNYNFNNNKKNIFIIMAGNIPLVGFHDFICCLFSGHDIYIKLSKNDNILFPIIVDYLKLIQPNFKNRIHFVDFQFNQYDAIIATGSDNTISFFNYHFKSKPKILRKHRNSIAVISGYETKQEIILLGDDIFSYFGLGCRNVSKIYVPVKYNFEFMIETLMNYNFVLKNRKYFNNYKYYNSLFSMDKINYRDNNFWHLIQSKKIHSPISVINYEYYKSKNHLNKIILNKREKIQCIISNGLIEDSDLFGSSQTPSIFDFSDNIDTMKFLENI